MMRRQAIDSFAAALDSPGSVGTLDAQFDAGLRSLLAVAGQFEVLPIRPPAQFRAELRDRLVAAAEQSVVSSPLDRGREALTSWRVRRTARLAFALACALVIFASIAVASTRALPGDPLYAAKRATESLRLSLARGDSARAEVQIELARRRLDEIGLLVARRHYDRLLPVFAQMDAATLAAARSSTTDQARAELHDFAVTQAGELAAVAASLEGAAAARANLSLALLAGISDTAGGAAGGAATEFGGVPRAPVDGTVGATPPAPLGSRADPAPGPTGAPTVTTGAGQAPAPGGSVTRDSDAAPGAPAPLPSPSGAAATTSLAATPKGATAGPLPGVSTAPQPTGAGSALPTPAPTATAPVPPVPTTSTTPIPSGSVAPPPLPTASVSPLPSAPVSPIPSLSVPPLPSASLPPLPTGTLAPIPPPLP